MFDSARADVAHAILVALGQPALSGQEVGDRVLRRSDGFFATRVPSYSMERIQAGRAHCALCGEVIRPGEDAFVTPDFLADELDPFWRFSDAPMHRPCFLVWDRRKAFVARYNRVVRLWVGPDGSHPRMTSEGEIV